MISYNDLKKGLKDLRITKVTQEKILTYFINNGELDELNTILRQQRLLRKHKIAHSLAKGTRGYNILIWMHPIIEDLSKVYGKTYQEMAVMYINIGIDLMVRGYGINKFKYYNEDILNRIDQLMTVENDESPDKTERLFRYYSRKTFEHYNKKITTMIVEDQYHLIKLREFIESRKINARKHIDGIFEQHNKVFPIYVLYGVKDEEVTKVDIKHSKLSKIING